MGAIVLAALALAGCGNSQIEACEEQLTAKLKSPASYKRISAEVTQIDESIHKPPYDSVTITYDAANSFNALLRDKEYCAYRPGTTEAFEPFASEADALSAVDNALDAAGNAYVPENLDAPAEDVEQVVSDEDEPVDGYVDGNMDLANYAGE